jgi:Protein of unknown function (DUF1573)/Abnormal spindle-like microcephaly-assoc'd, ASPM-SPD-2-Hydin/Immunoglobulin I-set domain
MNTYTRHRFHFRPTTNRSEPLSLFALILACLAGLSVVGCTGLAGAAAPAAKSSSTSSGTLAANATSLNFGNIVPGSNSPQTLILTNTGAAAVTISQATVTGAGFSVPGGMSSVSIAAGQSHAFQVQFAPASAGSASGNISIASDATDSLLAISLNGNGMTTLAITAQPVSQSVVVGQTATFSVLAAGTGTLTYQWKRSGTAISGATAASYTTPATTNSDNSSQFTVVVTDGSGSMTSNSAILTVTAAAVAPSIASQPANQAVKAGQSATFSVTATGTAPITYQWKKNGTAISGAASASYTTPATAASDNSAQFTVTVANSVSDVTSNAATLTVNVATPVLNASKTSLSFSSVNIGSNITLPVTFTNGGNSNVTISNVTISGAGYSAEGVQSGQILTPGQTAALNVIFAPAGTGLLPGSITVTSNAANSPESVSLSGTGVQAVTHSVTLTWVASTSSVSGYNGYRSTISGGPYTKLTSAPVGATTYVDATVQTGQAYYFVVRSVDSIGVESADSSEVSAIVP